MRYRLALPTHNRPLLIFVLAILLPSLALVLTGLSMIRQERLATEVQVRAGLEQVVERAALALSHELETWQRGIDGMNALTAIDPDAFPAAIREAIGILEYGRRLVAGKGGKTSCAINSSATFYTNPIRIRMIWERK